MVLLVNQVRTLTTNFQRLLAQATKEIKKLTAEKVTTIIKDVIIITESSQEANIKLIEIILLSVTNTIFTTAGWVGERAREVVDGERRARPRDEEAARAAEGVGGAGEGDGCGDNDDEEEQEKVKMMVIMMMRRSRRR